MAEDNYTASRAQLVQALVDGRIDYLQSLTAEQFRREMDRLLRDGGVGYENMGTATLIQMGVDAGLDRRHPRLIAALAKEHAPPQPVSVMRSVFSFEVLHEADRPVDDMGLMDLAYECDDGGFVGGKLRVLSTSQLSRAELDERAAALGSSADFFTAGLDDESDVVTQAVRPATRA